LKKLREILDARPKRVATVNPIWLRGSQENPELHKNLTPGGGSRAPVAAQSNARREKINIKKDAIKAWGKIPEPLPN
jgi:hypothetical protein